MSALALYDVLADIPDPRSRHGRRHPLAAMLGLITLGILLGHQGPEAIAQMGRDYGVSLAHALGFRRKKTPSKSTLSRFLRVLDVAAVEAALSRWIESRLPADANVFSLDGKTLRGSKDGSTLGQHLVSAYVPHVQAVLGQVRVDAKTNEHKAALQLLGILPVKGRVVLGDAIFCQRDVCADIVDSGGDYVFPAKDNQKGLATDVAAGFAFEATAFSPRRQRYTTAPTAGGDDREETWAAGETNPADDDAVDVAPPVAGAGARF
jgi:hypothetical protein